MKPRTHNGQSLRASFAAVAVLGLGALSGCVSMAGSTGPCIERSGTIFYVSTTFNEKCARLQFAEELTKVPAPDVVSLGLRLRAQEDPSFGKLLAETNDPEIKQATAQAPAAGPMQMVECDVVNVRIVGGRKEFDLQCPTAP